MFLDVRARVASLELYVDLKDSARWLLESRGRPLCAWVGEIVDLRQRSFEQVALMVSIGLSRALLSERNFRPSERQRQGSQRTTGFFSSPKNVLNAAKWAP